MQRRPDQLPPGTHGLGRDHVARHQRRRIYAALGQLMVELGYAGTSVELISRRAGISRRTFYDHFADRDAAALAYFDRSTVRLLAEIDGVLDDEAIAPPGRIDAAVAAALRLASAHPDAARAWLTRAGRSHERLSDHRGEALAALERRLAAQLKAEGRRAPRPLALELRVGGVCEVVRGRLLAHESALTELAPALTFVLRQPAA